MRLCWFSLVITAVLLARADPAPTAGDSTLAAHGVHQLAPERNSASTNASDDNRAEDRMLAFVINKFKSYRIKKLAEEFNRLDIPKTLVEDINAENLADVRFGTNIFRADDYDGKHKTILENLQEFFVSPSYKRLSKENYGVKYKVLRKVFGERNLAAVINYMKWLTGYGADLHIKLKKAQFSTWKLEKRENIREEWGIQSLTEGEKMSLVEFGLFSIGISR